MYGVKYVGTEIRFWGRKNKQFKMLHDFQQHAQRQLKLIFDNKIFIGCVMIRQLYQSTPLDLTPAH